MQKWLYSPAVDLPLLVLVTLSSLVPWTLSTHFGWPLLWIVLLAGVFNGAHQISTWTRVYFRSDERLARPFHYLVMPALLIGFVVSTRFIDELWGPIVLRTVLFYWASWHFVSQCWGIMRLYQRKHGAHETPIARLEKALIFLPAVFFVLRRLHTGPWMLFGAWIWHPETPAWLVNAVGAVTVGLALVYLILIARKPVFFVRPLFIGTSAFGFFVPYMLMKDGSAAFAGAALWHALQYIGIVWISNRRHFTGPTAVRKDWLDRALSWLCQPGRTVHYFASMIVPGFAAYVLVKAIIPLWHLSAEQAVGMVWSGGTLAHYYLDGVIWKFKRYAPELKPIAA
jgi:hypothetical protein